MLLRSSALSWARSRIPIRVAVYSGSQGPLDVIHITIRSRL